ncbi:MAG: hypothetical protein RIR39_2224 [Pseudomonadota bacterium]|jgi:hypothetical protein
MLKNLIWFFLLSSSVAIATERPASVSPSVEHGGHDHSAMGMGQPTAWTSLPILKTKTTGTNRENTVITIVPQNIVSANIDAYSNNLKDADARRQLPMGMAGAKLDKPATGGFQILTAREEQEDSVHMASTVYYFGERGAKNPTEMFMQQKNELEIIPQPYPREHSRYRANEDWKFLVRFNSKSLSNQKVTLETSNGSNVQIQTDAMGVLSVHIPDDFKPEEKKKEGGAHDHGMRRGADLVLATEHIDGGKTYLTAFNSAYGADAYDKRNLAMGIGFVLLGMVGASPLLRQKKIEKKIMASAPTEQKEEV